jgi:hypothetical protein
MYRSTLDLDCHVRSGANAIVLVSVDKTDYRFDLAPTINWVASSSATSAHRISLDLVLDTTVPDTGAYEVAVKIKAEGSDVLVCGYTMSQGLFQITSQPVWDEDGWQPYDISGHQGADAQFQGNGSLQILNGQTVEFVGTVIAPVAS